MVSNKLEGLAVFQNRKHNAVAFDALISKMRLLCRLGFLVENGLGLTTKTSLFHVITTSTLSRLRSSASFVLSDFDFLVIHAIWVIAENFPLFWESNHATR